MGAVVAVTILLQLGVIYLPFMETFFKLVPLSLKNLLISIGAGSLVFFVVLVIERKLNKGNDSSLHAAAVRE